MLTQFLAPPESTPVSYHGNRVPHHSALGASCMCFCVRNGHNICWFEAVVALCGFKGIKKYLKLITDVKNILKTSEYTLFVLYDSGSCL